MTLSPGSRYAGIETKALEMSDGSRLVYLGRRLVPLPDRFAQIGTHVVEQGERPDHVAARRLGDPEQFWRLCDANGVLAPQELTARPGSRVRITLPEGLPGMPDA